MIKSNIALTIFTQTKTRITPPVIRTNTIYASKEVDLMQVFFAPFMSEGKIQVFKLDYENGPEAKNVLCQHI